MKKFLFSIIALTLLAAASVFAQDPGLKKAAGGLYQVSIPIEFTYSGTGYRIVLDYCSQLASDLSVFLPREFVW